MTTPTLIPDYVPDVEGVYEHLDALPSWVNRDGAPRDEIFMSTDLLKTYSYGKSAAIRHTYAPVFMDVKVLALMLRLNLFRNTRSEYNICVLNRYTDQHKHLGWHCDDSPEQDPNHPIAVVSFGASRYIYVRENGFKGTVPPENRYLLTPGSLFEMPPGYQETHQHKIPKHDTACGGRISLTFRKLDR